MSILHVLYFLVLTAPLYSQFFGSWRDPRWQTVGVGPVSNRPTTCTAQRHVWLCIGTGCGFPGEVHYCAATNSWSVPPSGQAQILSDTYANRPAAGLEGRLFLPRDGLTSWWDTGTAWRGWGPLGGWLLTPAPLSGWTWVNQGGATADDTSGAIVMSVPASSTDNLRVLDKALPAAPSKIVIGLIPTFLTANWQLCGIALRDSTSGKLQTLAVANGNVIQNGNWTNPTTWFGTVTADIALQSTAGPGFLRVIDDGTNRTWAYSRDGLSWMQASQVLNTNFLTPDRYGLFCNFTNNKTGKAAIFHSQAGPLAQSPLTYVGSFYTSANKTLTLQTSADASTWYTMGVNYPDSGPVRDPSIIKLGSTWYIAHTNVSGITVPNTSFKIISSSDLYSWSVVASPDWSSSIPGVNRVWAPEWFKNPSDGSEHIFFAASTNGHAGPFSIYETHPVTPGIYTSWTAAYKVSGFTTNSLIDPFLLKVGSTYYLWFKNETAGYYIEYATASNELGPYSHITHGDWAGWGHDMEGPSLVQVGSNWRLFLDDYLPAGQHIKWSESADGFKTWTAKQAISAEYIMSHGTAYKP